MLLRCQGGKALCFPPPLGGWEELTPTTHPNIFFTRKYRGPRVWSPASQHKLHRGGPERSLYARGGPHDFARSANSWGTLAAAGWGLQGGWEPRGAAKGARTFRPYWPAAEGGGREESCGNPCANPGAISTHPPPTSSPLPHPPICPDRAARKGRQVKTHPAGPPTFSKKQGTFFPPASYHHQKRKVQPPCCLSSTPRPKAP